MAAVYPTSISVIPDVTNEVDDVDAAHRNRDKDEIIALQTYIGTNPHGSKSSLTDRLAVMMATNGAIAQSNGGFPAGTVDGRFFWRPDLTTAYVQSSDGNWNSLGQSLSNTIFSFGEFGLNGTNALVTGTNLGGITYSTYFITKFRKITGISSVVNYVRWYGTVGSEDLYARVSVGSAVGTTSKTGGTPTWTNFTISLSALNAGSVYDLVFELATGGAGGGDRPVVLNLVGFGI